MFRAWNPDPIGHHQASLKDLDPRLVAVVQKVQTDNPGLRFVFGSGRRTFQLQQMAWAWGWSKTRTGRHRTGTAVDLWPLDAQGHVVFERDAQKRIGVAIMRAAEDTGVQIRWGGDFHGYKDHDRSHFEIRE
jgi:peptidoglycan LD-endopeptidase CwlK